ncbi:butyrophilin subfamily 3 member A2-like [Malaclemys terrapin pileata]|nr:butyrophilin subfamily 3 member A2-like [Malaclemys terrapin pileata]
MELFSTEWTKGNMSLKLNNVQLPDRGKYVCSVAAGDWYDKVAIELEVTATGNRQRRGEFRRGGQGHRKAPAKRTKKSKMKERKE